jgi:hypothetical protein
MRAGAVPARADSQLTQRQFHCGTPPPAAEPRTRTIKVYIEVDVPRYAVTSAPSGTYSNAGFSQRCFMI